MAKLSVRALLCQDASICTCYCPIPPIPASEYEFHPESKCADAAGKPCGKQTIGLLERRHIRIDQIKYIGKESNSLEEVDQGLIHSTQNVYTEYPDPRRDEWSTKVLPAQEPRAGREAL